MSFENLQLYWFESLVSRCMSGANDGHRGESNRLEFFHFYVPRREYRYLRTKKPLHNHFVTVLSLLVKYSFFFYARKNTCKLQQFAMSNNDVISWHFYLIEDDVQRGIPALSLRRW